MSVPQSKTLYIDPPTIPAGLTIQTYRELRQLQRSRKVRGLRRISRKAMVV
jgi:hypothetical protein